MNMPQNQFAKALQSASVFCNLSWFLQSANWLQTAFQPNPNTGEIPTLEWSVQPTHYKCPQTGALLPVENPETWVYPNDPNHPQEAA
jgi:hypothetical protein